MERPIVSLDLETTGLYPNTDRICQIGLIKVYPDGETNEWETLIDPDIPIPPEVSAIHGITDLGVKDAPTFKDLSEVLYKGLSGCDFTGYNAKSFDIPFMIEEFKRCGLRFVPGKIIDAFIIFKKYNTRNLTSAVRHYLGKDHVDAHSALADARASFEVLRQQLITHSLPRTVSELHDICWKDARYVDSERKFAWGKNGDVLFNFGANVNQSLKKAKPEYLQWIIRSNFSEEIKGICRSALLGKYPVKT